MFDFSQVQESNQSYIGTGVHEVVISNIKKEVNDNGNSYMEIEFTKQQGGNKMSNSIRLYLTPKAMPSTQQKLLNIGNNVSADFSSLTTFEEIANELINKPIRIRFNGEQYAKNDGTVGLRPTIGLSDFSEAIIDGALHPAVSRDQSTLFFDEERHIKKLEEQPAQTNYTPQPSGSSPYSGI